MLSDTKKFGIDARSRSASRSHFMPETNSPTFRASSATVGSGVESLMTLHRLRLQQRIGVPGEAGRFLELHGQELAAPALVGLDEHEAVGAGAALEARVVRAALALDKNFVLGAEQLAYARVGDLVEQAQEHLVALHLHVLRQLALHRGGRRVAARRVAEDEAVVEADFAHEIARLLEVLVRLAGKADDDIRGEGHARLR